MPRQSLIPLLVVVFAGLLAVGCNTRSDKNQTGGVALSVSDFDGLPVQSMASVPFDQIETLTIQSIVKDPFGPVSDLMNVELRSYEVTYTRADTGTRNPPPMVRGIFGVVPVNGTFTINGLPWIDNEALSTEPLTDLLVLNGGVDQETGLDSVHLNARLVFFGKTISGDEVRSGPANFSVRVTQ